MSSASQTLPSSPETDDNGNSCVVDDPELGRNIIEDTQSQHETLIRQGSDASSSSSSTSTSSSSTSDDHDVTTVVTLIGSTANLCSATLGKNGNYPSEQIWQSILVIK